MTEHDGSALLRNPQISAVGIQLLSDALRDQGVSVTDATWQPPSEGMASYLSQIAADQRRLDANQQAVQAMIEARPEVVGEYSPGRVGSGEETVSPFLAHPFRGKTHPVHCEVLSSGRY